MMNWDRFFSRLRQSGLNAWADELQSSQQDWLVDHGDYLRWSAALNSLPIIDNIRTDFSLPAITIDGDCHESDQLEQALKGLMPWRKGPYQFAHHFIDCEWRSDFKWQRVHAQLSSLKSRKILDVGCGNGYHCWRMLADEPELVLGIEPSVLFNLQFYAAQSYIQHDDIFMLPLGIEDMPEDLGWFDTVFSMGVLYHRRSPIDHLYQLKSLLAPGGELCLETLVIAAGRENLLVPDGRYARMRNVWFIPTADELCRWLQRCGFENPRVVDESTTSIDEQRSTEWMQFESLQNSLDEQDRNLTVEGLPAPRRAVILATKP